VLAPLGYAPQVPPAGRQVLQPCRLPHLRAPRPPRTALFPYTTLFRSRQAAHVPQGRGGARPQRARPARVGEPESSSGSPGSASKDRKSTRLNSSHVKISYAVFGSKKKNSGKRGLTVREELHGVEVPE